jgi:hypothetical protein
MGNLGRFGIRNSLETIIKLAKQNFFGGNMGVIAFGFILALVLIPLTAWIEYNRREKKVNNRKTNVVVDLKNHTSWRR